MQSMDIKVISLYILIEALAYFVAYAAARRTELSFTGRSHLQADGPQHSVAMVLHTSDSCFAISSSILHQT